MGTHPYRQFLRGELGDRLYVSRFVDMEFKRGVLLTLIEFLNTLAMPQIKTIEDAERAWSNKFQPRQVKLLLTLSAQIFDRNKLDRTDPRNKERGITALAVTIKSLERAMRRRFLRLSDRTHCPCGEHPLRASVSPERARGELNAYADHFRDKASSHQKCHMKEFFEHFRPALSACVQHIETLPNLDEHERLKGMAAKIRKIQGGTLVCSCGACKNLGDAVIAVGAPRHMQLETTDRSFSHWCDPIRQPKRVHCGELEYLKGLGSKSSTS